MGPLSNKLPPLYYSANPIFKDGHVSDTVKMWTKSKPEFIFKKLNFKECNFYEPKKIIYNNKATVVFWKDGTKTVVKMAEGTTYSKYNAFCAALAKKIFGSNSAVNRTVASGIEQK